MGRPAWLPSPDGYAIGAHPLQERLDTFFNELATDLRHDYIAPFCRRRRYTFIAGNGTFIFVDRANKIVPDARIPTDLYELLNNLCGPNGVPLAAFCNDVRRATPKTHKE